MSALDDLSPIAKHALWVSCMHSNVPVQIADPATIERVSALLRSESPTDSTTGRYAHPVAPPPSITVPRALPEARNAPPSGGDPL